MPPADDGADAHRSKLPNTSPLSYASILQDAASPKPMEVQDLDFSDEDYVFSSGEHGPNLSFADNVLNAFDQEWKNSVIVNLMGKPNSVNSYDFILRGLRRKWKSHGGWKLIDLMNEYFIVKFDMEADLIEALVRGPWILAGQTLVVRRWKSNFDARTDKISSMATWIRIMGLPIRYFNRFAMSKIGKLIGDVVKIDFVTLLQERGKFARICVEIDLDKPLQPVIEVDGMLYGIKYEGLSLLCFNCGIYGHSKDHCPSGNMHYVPPPAEAMDVQPGPCPKPHAPHVVQPSSAPIKSAIPDDVLGPWMLIDYKSKKKSKQAANIPKINSQGSRFSVLQDNSVDNSSLEKEKPPSASLQTSMPVMAKDNVTSSATPSGSTTDKIKGHGTPKSKSVPKLFRCGHASKPKLKKELFWVLELCWIIPRMLLTFLNQAQGPLIPYLPLMTPLSLFQTIYLPPPLLKPGPKPNLKRKILLLASK